jgi:hypothetical protein
MRVFYVAGPYRSNTEWGLVENIRQAEYVASLLWSWGFAVISPHKNTAHFGGIHGLNDDVWLKGDLEILKRCDMVVVLPGWENSSGTKEEIELAKENHMPIYYWPEDYSTLCRYQLVNNA